MAWLGTLKKAKPTHNNHQQDCGEAFRRTRTCPGLGVRAFRASLSATPTHSVLQLAHACIVRSKQACRSLSTPPWRLPRPSGRRPDPLVCAGASLTLPLYPCDLHCYISSRLLSTMSVRAGSRAHRRVRRHHAVPAQTRAAMRRLARFGGLPECSSLLHLADLSGHGPEDQCSSRDPEVGTLPSTVRSRAEPVHAEDRSVKSPEPLRRSAISFSLLSLLLSA
ncbi:hypothetical protein V8E36_006473 [Tilletia maclaganii]